MSQMGDEYEDTSLLTSYVPFTWAGEDLVLSNAISFGDEQSIINWEEADSSTCFEK